MNKLITIVLVFIAIVVVGGSFFYFSKGSLTSNEQVLFSILLTIASSLISWIISYLFFEKANKSTIEDIEKRYQSNLKTYATKAAEKVRNLSDELGNLAIYLRNELESDDHPNDHENLLAKEERIYSAIHIINTLKTINDGSLSDWKGVIPEEIAEEERFRMERITEILDDYKEAREIVALPEDDDDKDTEQREILKSALASLESKVDLALASISGVTIPVKPVRVREKVSRNCPACDISITYRQKALEDSRKKLKCSACGTKLIGTWNPIDDFKLREAASEPDGFGRMEPDENVIESIRIELPEQPWTKGISDTIAEKLNLRKTLVHRAITILIKRGVFKDQKGGEIIEDSSGTDVVL